MRNIFQTAGVKVLKLGAHGEIKMFLPRGATREKCNGEADKKNAPVISALRGNNHVSPTILKTVTREAGVEWLNILIKVERERGGGKRSGPIR